MDLPAQILAQKNAVALTVAVWVETAESELIGASLINFRANTVSPTVVPLADAAS